MVDLGTWRDRSRSALQLVLLGTSGLIVLGTRALIGADDLSDLDDLSLIGATILVLAIAIAMAVHVAKSPATAAGRIVVRLCPVGLVLLGVCFVESSYADVSIELESIARTKAPEAAAASIVVGPGGRDVRLVGELATGDAARLETLLAANPAVERIHLTSEGGLADEGQAIGEVVAAHGLVTFVPDYCVSACTLVFVRGRERLVMQQSRLGFHAPYEEGLFGREFPGDSSAQRHDYVEAGVDPDFVDEALRVPPSGLWIPDAARLVAAKVATGVVDRYRFPDSNLDGSVDRASARALVLRTVPVLAAFEHSEPAVVDRIADWYFEGYRRGRSEGAAVDGLRAAADAAIARGLARADDRTLAALVPQLSDAMAAAMSSDECRAVGLNGDVVLAARLLGKTRDGGADDLITLLNAAITEATDEGTGRLASPQPSASLSDRPSCAEVRATFAAIGKRSDRDAATLMRAVLRRQVAARTAQPSITPASLTGP